MKRFVLVLAIMAMLSTVVLAAQVEVMAKVLNSSNNSAIEGASVTYIIDGTSFSGGTTNFEGLASPIFIEEGKTGEITASKNGFVSSRVSFRVPSPPLDQEFIQVVYLSDDDGDNGDDDSPVFNNIPDQFLDQDDDFHNNIVDLWAYASDDEDSDSELDFDLSQSDNDFIDCFIDDDQFIDCTILDEDKAGTVTLTARVTDTDGQSDSETFRVIFEEDNSDAFCSEINVEDDEVTIFDNRTTTHEISVFNDSSRTFNVDLVQVSESSPYFSVQPMDDDFSITPGESEDISLRFIGQNVTGTKTATIKLRLIGEFSNGVDCHFDDIEEEIEVTIRDAAGGEDDDIEMTILPSTIDLLPGQSKTVNATIENNFSTTKCFDLQLSENSSGVTASIEDDEFCLSRDDDRELDIVISAASNAPNQTTNVQLEADYSSGTKFGFINVKIGSGTPQGPTEPKEITVTGFSSTVALLANESKAFTATIGNKLGIDMTNVAVTMTGLPQGVFFEPAFIPRVSKDSITTIASTIKTTGTVQTGNYTVFLEVASDQGRTVKPITFNVANTGSAQDGDDNSFPSGFFGLAGLAGSALVLLLILVIVVAIIAAIVRRK